MTSPLFAARPLANRALSDPAVPIWPYRSGALLDFTGSSTPTAFADADLDIWGRMLAEAVDWVLSDEFAAPIAIVDARTAQTRRDQLLGAKETLAQRFSELIAPLFADQPPDPEALAAAREQYRVSLIAALANAYAGRGPAAPLRSVPAPPALVSQSARPRDVGETASLDELLQWVYVVEYAQADRAAQDQLHFSLLFGIPAAPPRASAPDPLFHALAEFATVFPDLLEDLELRLLPIAESSTDAAIAEAAAVLGSFVNAVARVAQKWSAVEPLGRALNDAFPTLTEFARNEDLVIRLDAPAGVVTPLIGGYTTTHLPAPPFDFEFVDPEGQPLAAVEGRALPYRALVSPPRQIVADRAASFTAAITRNAQLLFPDPRPTAPDFVYQTAPVTFAAPCHAHIDRDQPVDLAQIAAPPATLAAYWTAFLDRVFGPDPQAVDTSLSAAYEFEAAPGITPVLPIFKIPNIVGVPDPAVIEEAIVEWMRSTEPERDSAMLRFDLAVTSTASGERRPLLRLRNISIAGAAVTGL